MAAAAVIAVVASGVVGTVDSPNAKWLVVLLVLALVIMYGVVEYILARRERLEVILDNVITETQLSGSGSAELDVYRIPVRLRGRRSSTPREVSAFLSYGHQTVRALWQDLPEAESVRITPNAAAEFLDILYVPLIRPPRQPMIPNRGHRGPGAESFMGSEQEIVFHLIVEGGPDLESRWVIGRERDFEWSLTRQSET